MPIGELVSGDTACRRSIGAATCSWKGCSRQWRLPYIGAWLILWAMASQAAAIRRGARGRRRNAPEGPSGPLAWVLAIPPWLRMTLLAALAIVLVGGAGWGA